MPLINLLNTSPLNFGIVRMIIRNKMLAIDDTYRIVPEIIPNY